MSNSRRNYTKGEEIALVSQVESRCPLCGKQLFNKKKGREYKAYDLAHIYPLNPDDEEIETLKGLPRLSADVNDPDNIIPLCESCHGKYDKPRTVEEYVHLMDIKRQAISRFEQHELQTLFPIEKQIGLILAGLQDSAPMGASEGLTYEPKKLDEKFDETMPVPMRQKVRHGVSDYYLRMRSLMQELERDSPTASDLISSQVRTYYLKQTTLGLSQQDIFNNIVDWILRSVSESTREGSEAVVSYFVQNCEVFE